MEKFYYEKEVLVWTTTSTERRKIYSGKRPFCEKEVSIVKERVLL